jgi:hypothetical protein
MLEWNKQHALCPVLKYLGFEHILAEPYLPSQEISDDATAPLPEIWFDFSGPYRGVLNIRSLHGPQRDLHVYICRQIGRGEYTLGPKERRAIWHDGSSEMRLLLPEKPGEWLIACVRNSAFLDFCFATHDYAARPTEKIVIPRTTKNGWSLHVENRSAPPSNSQPESPSVAALRPYFDSAQQLARSGVLGMTTEEVVSYWSRYPIGISRLVLLVSCGLRLKTIMRVRLGDLQQTRIDLLVKECWPEYVAFMAEVDHPSDEEQIWAFFALHGGRRKASFT